jgi:uridylate kinase
LKIVLKISGKLITPEDTGYISKISKVVAQLIDKGYRVAIVVGGGPIARRYINACRELKGSESLCDLIGIMVTRLNAMLLINALGELAYNHVPRSAEEFNMIWNTTNRVIVTGGFQPAQSTVAVSTILAELINADLIVMLTIVDGIYDKDPNKDPGAKKLESVKASELKKLLLFDQKNIAGGYELLDQISLSIIERSKLKVAVINGKDPENIIKLLSGQKIGTWVYG